MNSVIQWISQIIIFLILATVIDLLIPATAIKKYIKLVFGLILMLIFLKPVFHLFTIDIEGGLETSFNQLFAEEINPTQLENEMNLRKREIQASQDAYILEQLNIQLKDLAAKPLLDEFQLAITEIRFIFSTDELTTYEELLEVVVYLKEADKQEGVVATVDEVIIPTEKQVEVKNKLNEEEIIILLTDIWELKDKRLTISWEGGTT